MATNIGPRPSLTDQEPMSLPLSKEKMPDCWKDDMKMDSLFSQFRQRTVNPLDWDSKLKFWKTLISDWCLDKSVSSFTLADLRKTFQRNGRAPLCFPTVIETMLRNNELSLYSDFVNVPPEKSWSAWTMDVLVKKPIVWSFNKVKDSLVTPTATTGEDEYVNLAVVKNQGEALLASIHNCKRGELYEVDELLAVQSKDQLGSVKDIGLAIHWLRRQGKAALTHPAEGRITLIKLASLTEKKVVITELDLGIHALKQNEKALIKHLEQLEQEKLEALDEARVFVKKGMRQVAKSSLRKKNELEKSINKRASALENVQLLLGRIREAESDAKVLDAYKLGVAALKTTFKEAGISEGSVADTMSDVEDVLDIHAEIQATLAQPIDVSADEDLEEELAELMRSNAPSSPPPPATPPKKTQKLDEDTDLEDRLKALRTSLPEPPRTLPPTSIPKIPVKQQTFLP